MPFYIAAAVGFAFVGISFEHPGAPGLSKGARVSAWLVSLCWSVAALNAALG